MDFRGYQSLEDSYRQRFGDRLAAFPFAAMALEAELRNVAAGDREVAARNVGRLARHHRAIDWALSVVPAMVAEAEAPQVYVNLPGFGAIAGEVRDALARDPGWRSFSDRRIARVKANKVLHKLCTKGAAFPRAMRLFSQGGADAVIADRALLERLNAELSANHGTVKDFIQRQDIRAFVALGEAKPHERMVLNAARDLGRPYVVLAHGYVSDPGLLSIAPIRADALVLWTRRQCEMVAEAVPENRQALRCFGFPVRTALHARKPGNRVLFAWELLGRQNKWATHEAVLDQLGRQCRQAGLQPVFRAHPKERHDRALMGRIEAMGFVLDAGDLAAALASARMVVSSNSTVLTEAAALGIPAFQIAELVDFRFEGAPSVAAADFPPIDALPPPEAPFPPFDVDRFAAEIRSMAGSAGP